MKNPDYLASNFTTGLITVGTVLVHGFIDPGHVTTQGIQLIADNANAGIVYIGSNSSVSASNGYPLIANDSVFLRLSDLNQIYMIADTASQKIRYIYM